jgi:hypothetical protein
MAISSVLFSGTDLARREEYIFYRHSQTGGTIIISSMRNQQIFEEKKIQFVNQGHRIFSVLN